MDHGCWLALFVRIFGNDQKNKISKTLEGKRETTRKKWDKKRVRGKEWGGWGEGWNLKGWRIRCEGLKGLRGEGWRVRVEGWRVRASGALTEAAHLQVFFFSSSDPLLNFYKKTTFIPKACYCVSYFLIIVFVFTYILGRIHADDNNFQIHFWYNCIITFLVLELAWIPQPLSSSVVAPYPPGDALFVAGAGDEKTGDSAGFSSRLAGHEI